MNGFCARGDRKTVYSMSLSPPPAAHAALMSRTAADMSSAPTAAAARPAASICSFAGSLLDDDKGWSPNQPVSGRFSSVNCGVSGSGYVVVMAGGGTLTSSFRDDLAEPMEGERVLLPPPPACRLLDLLPRRRELASTGRGTLTRWIVCRMAGLGLRGAGHMSTESVSLVCEESRRDAVVVVDVVVVFRYSRYDGGGARAAAGLLCGQTTTGDGWPAPCSQA